MRFFNHLKLRNICNKGFNGGSFHASSRKFCLLSWTDSKPGSCGSDNMLAQRYLSGSIFGSSTPSVRYHQHLVDHITCDDRMKKHLEAVLQEFGVATEEHNTYLQEKKCSKLQPLSQIRGQIQELERIQAEMKKNIILSELENEGRRDLFTILTELRKVLESNLQLCMEKIFQLVIPVEEVDDRDIVMELSAGVGGKEATLFVEDLVEMYHRFAKLKKWKYQILNFDIADRRGGGLSQAHISIRGLGAYRTLKLESGVHTMQRLPKTKRPSQMRTSTVTVAVLPQPTDDFVIDPKVEFQSFVIVPEGLKVEFHSSDEAGFHLTDVESELDPYYNPEALEIFTAHAVTIVRAKVYQSELESRNRNSEQSRDMRIGTAGGSEKVRTYDFTKNLITDHRLQESVDDVDGFLQGPEKLDHLIDKLQRWWCMQSLHNFLEKYS